MKRLLSVILSIAMILAFIPSAFAADGEITPDLGNVKVYHNTTTKSADKITLTQGENLLAVESLSVRRYGSTNDTGPYIAFSFAVEASDIYTISFKTDETGFGNKATAVAPAIYIKEGALTNETYDDFLSLLYTDADKVGYFDFSKISKANEYQTMTIAPDGVDSGKPREVVLKEGKTYTIAIRPDFTSLLLNNKTTKGDVDTTKYHFFNNAIRPVDNDGGILDTGGKQNIRISGITFTPVAKPENVYKNPSSSSLLADRNGTSALIDMEVRRYGATGENGPLLAIPFTVDKTGDYTFAFKTSEEGIANKAVAAVPGVHVFEYSMTENRHFDFISKYAESHTHVGYFDFSALTEADKFVPMNIGADGEAKEKLPTANLTAGKQYTLVFFCDAISLGLNNNTKKGEVDLSVYDCDTTGVRTIDGDVALPLSYKQDIYLAGIEMNYVEPEVPEEDEELTGAFDDICASENVSYSAPSVSAYSYSMNGGSGASITPIRNANGTYTFEAPEKMGDAEFLYWAKGLSSNKKIVSLTNEFTYVPESRDANYLIAVYNTADYDADTKEYYNANGQRIAVVPAEGEEPELPSMAGYGEASEWVKYKDTNIYVAKYEEKEQPDITVTVDGEANTVPYGTEIVCRADETKGIFKCWTKNGVIVSAESVYSFNAWENCTVEAVYAAEEFTYTGNAMKILIDDFVAGNETAVMAEFIGFGSNVVEKGIMFVDENENATRIAMTKQGNQFTVVADEEGTYSGYAIVKNENGTYTEYTEGSFEKK